MSLRKFATFEVLSKTLVPKDASKATLRRLAHRHEFNYEPRPGFLYVRSRAISSRCNDNFDEFPAEEIKKAYATFIGKPVFVNHVNDNHRRARGVIIDAALHEDRNPDGTPDTWAEVLMEVDAVRFPKLAQAILAGHIDRTSMGTDVAYSICSACNNKATSPAEYCQHIPRMKGSRIYRATASGKKEGVLIREKCYGLGFFENSLLVEEPADPTAYFLGVDDRGLKASASKVSAKDASLAAVVKEDVRKEAIEVPISDGDREFYQQVHEQGQRDQEMREHAQQRPVDLSDPADLKAHLFETHGWDENDLWRNSHPADHPAMMGATDEDRPLTHTELRDAHEHEHNVEYPDEYQGAVTLGDSHFHTASKTAAGPMGTTPRRGDGRHKHRVTSHCRVCGSDIYLVNGTNWQHDIDSGAGLPHQAVPADDPDEDDDASTAQASGTTAAKAASAYDPKYVSEFAQRGPAYCAHCDEPIRFNADSRNLGQHSEHYGEPLNGWYHHDGMRRPHQAVPHDGRSGADQATYDAMKTQEASVLMRHNLDSQFDQLHLRNQVNDAFSHPDLPGFHGGLLPRTAFPARKKIKDMSEEELAAHRAEEAEGDQWHVDHPIHHQNIIDHWNQATEDEKSNGMNWYQDAHHLTRHIANDTHTPMHTMAGLMANYSAQTHWATNIMNAAKSARLKVGLGGKGSGIFASDQQRTAANRLHAGEHYDKVLTGPKVKSFAHLIEHGGNADPNDPKVVVDRHALSVAAGARATDMAYERSGLSGKKRYQAASDAYHAAAEHISRMEGRKVEAHQVQAATWLVRQRLNEAHDRELSATASSRTAANARAAIAEWNKYAGEHHPGAVGKEPGLGYSHEFGLAAESARNDPRYTGKRHVAVDVNDPTRFGFQDGYRVREYPLSSGGWINGYTTLCDACSHEHHHGQASRHNTAPGTPCKSPRHESNVLLANSGAQEPSEYEQHRNHPEVLGWMGNEFTPREHTLCPSCAEDKRSSGADMGDYTPMHKNFVSPADQCRDCGHLLISGRKEASVKRTAYGETFAPADVDTLRDEKCPVCGEQDSYDGNACQVCGFDAPPQMFQDPDLDKAKNLDLRKDVLDDAGTLPGQDGMTPDEQDANGGLPGEVPGEGVPGSDAVPVDPSMVTEDGEVTPTTDPEQILQMQMEQLQQGIPLTPDQLGPNGEIGVGDPGLDPEADVDAATGHVNQGGEPFTPGPNAPQQPGEPEGPVSPEDLDEDGEPTDGQQINPGAGDGVPGTPEDGVPDLQCPACGFTADAAQPTSVNMDDPMAPNTDGGGAAAGDLCPNCQQALLISPGEAEQMQQQPVQGGVPVQAARRQADLDPSQFETPIRPRMQDYLNHPYAWPDVAEKMHSSSAARDDWQSLWKAKDKHEKAAFVAYLAGNHDKEQMHLDAALTAHRASNEARLAVEYPRDEHPLFGRGGPLEGVPPEEWDERMGLK